MLREFLPRAVEDPGDDEARGMMLLAAAYAGVGFGNAGVHLPHGMSYPVSGMVKTYHSPGYPGDRPLVPHGVSVILNAPAVFRFTAQACPEAGLKPNTMPDRHGSMCQRWMFDGLNHLGYQAVGGGLTHSRSGL